MTLSEYTKKHYKIACTILAVFVVSLISLFWLQLDKKDSPSEVFVFKSDQFKNSFFKAMYHVDMGDGVEQGVWKYISPSKKGIVMLAFKGESFRIFLKTRNSGADETVVYDVSGRFKINGGAIYFDEPKVAKIFNSQAVIVMPVGQHSFELFCDGQPSLVFNKVKSF